MVACCARRRSRERDRRDAGRSPPGERGAPTECRGRGVPSCLRDASSRSAREIHRRRLVSDSRIRVDEAFVVASPKVGASPPAWTGAQSSRDAPDEHASRDDGARSRWDGDVPLLPRHDPLRAHRVDCHRGASESRRFRRVVRRSRAPSQSPSPPLLTPPRPIRPVPGHRAPSVQGVLRRLRHRGVGHAR